ALGHRRMPLPSGSPHGANRVAADRVACPARQSGSSDRPRRRWCGHCVVGTGASGGFGQPTGRAGPGPEAPDQAPALLIRSSRPGGHVLANLDSRNRFWTWVRKAATSGVVTLTPLPSKKVAAVFSVSMTPSSFSFFDAATAPSIAFCCAGDRPFQK